MRTYVGSVIVESLADAAVLGSLTPLVERVFDMPGDPDATTWHVRWYRLDEQRLRRLLPSLAHATLPHWYAHFWSGDDLCVVLAGKAFWAKVHDRSTWSDFIRYGDGVGVERKWTEHIPTELPGYVQAALGADGD